jgi:hypothetical protein
MINSELEAEPSGEGDDEAVDHIMQSGAGGALMLAGIATAIVIALWFAFYLLVFVPRGVSP